MNLKLIALGALLPALCLSASAQGTAFTYQGQLNSAGSPANGSYDFQFILFNDAQSGLPVGPILTSSAVPVSNGLFSATLDFGPGVFTGTSLWLDLSVRTNSNGAFAELLPRQALLPVPYAIMANSASNLLGSLPAAQLSGTIANGALPASLNLSGTVTANAFAGDGGALTNVTAGALTLPSTAVSADIIYSGNASLLYGDNNGNFFSGQGAGNPWLSGSDNTALGVQSLASITNGSYNTAVGFQALAELGLGTRAGGTNNIALGWRAGFRYLGNESGNIDIGNFGQQGENNTIRIGNGQTQTFIAGVINGDGGGLTNVTAGALTLPSTAVGADIIYSGSASLLYGDNNGNFFSGQSAGNSAVNGSNNTAIGDEALAVIRNGSDNTAVGYQALFGFGFLNAGGSNNIALGSRAGFLYLGSESDNITIGNQGQRGENNTIRIGTPGVHTNTFIAGVINGDGGGLTNITLPTPPGASGQRSTVGGGYDNTAGGDDSTVGGGGLNTAGGNDSTVGGGGLNTAGGNDSTVGGGGSNTAGGYGSTVGGGQLNMATLANSSVGGGANNTASGEASTVGGGQGNMATLANSTVGGGYYNTASGQTGNATATVGGGANNTASGDWSTVGGGEYNQATNTYATVPGGEDSTAGGQYSFAAGNQAQALHQGAFVWADSQSATFSSTANDQFLIRAQGGVGINTSNTSGATLTVNGTIFATGFSGNLSGLSLASGPVSAALNFTNVNNSFTGDGGGLIDLNVNASQLSGTIGNSQLANSWITIIAGTGLSVNGSGSGAVPLGGSITLSATGGGGGVLSVTGNSDITASTVGGAVTLGDTATNANVASTIVKRDASGNFLAGTITATSFSGAFTGNGAGLVNVSTATLATGAALGAGTNNSISTSGATDSFVGGGHGNTIGANSPNAAIVGGNDNIIQYNNLNAAIGGGDGNVINHDAGWSAIAGGNNNQISSGWGAIAGGGGNVINGNSPFSAIAGGQANAVQANAQNSTIGGGNGNTVGGQYATVPGGANNIAGGQYSFAAGQAAHAANSGSFVWNCDSTSISSTANNQFTARATGGFVFITSGTAGGATLAAGSGSWTTLSDRHAKEHFAAVNPGEVLAKVAALPLSTWNYKSQDAAIRHIGPMAQDFKAAFGVGETDTGISTVDADGVALAAIQGLNQKVEEKDAEIQTLKQRNDSLAQRLNELEAVVRTLAETK